MHRVELKEREEQSYTEGKDVVPNAPCGVESILLTFMFFVLVIVPNAPCGVERQEIWGGEVFGGCSS